MSIATVLRRFFDPEEREPTDRELADLGLSRADYLQLVGGTPGTRARMEALAKSFGVSPQMIDADRALALEIAETCGQCHVAGECQRALDGRGEFNPQMCPNARLYQQMTRH